MALQSCPKLSHGEQTLVSLDKPVIGHRRSPGRHRCSGEGRSLLLRAVLNEELSRKSQGLAFLAGQA